MGEIDLSQCDDVERVPGRWSGAWVVKRSRILADGIIENFEAGVTPEEIGEEIYDGLGAERARRIIAYARTHVRPPEPQRQRASHRDSACIAAAIRAEPDAAARGASDW